MKEERDEKFSELQDQLRKGKLDRRDFLRGAALLGVSLGAAQALSGCSGQAVEETGPAEEGPAAVKVPEVSTTDLGQESIVMGKDWQLMVDYNKCCGCRICELECAMHHHGVLNPDLARIKVYKVYPGVDIPMYCRNCWDTPCIEVCPTEPKAIAKDETTGAIKIDMELCIECDKCIEECRANVVRYHPEVGYLVCDLCDLEPVCVSECPTGALEVVPMIMAPEKWAIPVEEIARQRMEKLGLLNYIDDAFEEA
ncbi:MAG: twin-arginine translocation signal domain-containing protein [Anaerolineales bacterium]|nr:twin-arginine translocation signal domain-containing protein [Anaerolineales bacterium]